MIKLTIGIILLAIAAVLLYLELRNASTCVCNLPSCGGGCIGDDHGSTHQPH